MNRWLVVAVAVGSLGGTATGPLSTSQKLAEKTPKEVDKARAQMKREIPKGQVAGDIDALKKLLDLYFVPRTAEDREELKHRDVRLQPLANGSASIDSMFNSLVDVGLRFDFCLRADVLPWHCDTDFIARAPSTQPTFEVGVLPSKIARIVVRDLSDATNPAWQKLAGDLAKVAAAPAIILDLREAWGGDPRPLLPWLKTVTRRADLAPLREIHRPAQLDPYVAAYAAKYRVEARDRAVWAALVGTTPAATGPVKVPIAVLVGRHCEAACELVARVLETYANATVIGGVGSSGRLHRDEPAMATLPSSHLEIYFHATEYLLAPEIEAATGPTSEWWLRRRAEPVDLDGTKVAERELQRRIASPAPIACPYVGYKDSRTLPAAVRNKINDAPLLDDGVCARPQRNVSLEADASLHTMRRLVEACGGSWTWINRTGDGQFGFGVVVPTDVVSKLAQSPLVKRIYVNCSAEWTYD